MVRARGGLAIAVGGLALAWACNPIFGIEQFGPGPEDASVDAPAVGASGDGGRESDGAIDLPDAGPSNGKDGASAPEGGGDDAGCVPGTQQCSGPSLLTCSPAGHWGDPWACATDACAGSACTGPLPGGPSASCLAGGVGLSDCGDGGESCCASTEIPGGTYERTYGLDGGAAPSDPVTVSGFRLDTYEVTAARFTRYVTYLTSTNGAAPADGSGKHTHLNDKNGLVNAASPGGYEAGWDATHWNQYVPTGASAGTNWTTDLTCISGLTAQTTYTAADQRLPINCVTWYAAYAFCIWDGGFLPSEAEWEYAAAGGGEQRAYPWGSTDPGTQSQYADYGCYYPSGGGLCSPGLQNTEPAGAIGGGAGKWGQRDLAGNLSEWTRDAYEVTYVSPCVDCAFLAPPSATPEFVIRGGSYVDKAPALHPSVRSPRDASGYYTTGFRCAKSP
jgi:sulfatase modifying factor 1